MESPRTVPPVVSQVLSEPHDRYPILHVIACVLAHPGHGDIQETRGVMHREQLLVARELRSAVSAAIWKIQGMLGVCAVRWGLTGMRWRRGHRWGAASDAQVRYQVGASDIGTGLAAGLVEVEDETTHARHTSGQSPTAPE